MNTATVEKIANAVLYDGYMLYPYRLSSVKNQQRFNFGVLYPLDYRALDDGADASEMRTECIIQQQGDSATIEAKIRFLRMVERRDWQEGHEREVSTPAVDLRSIMNRPMRRPFTFADGVLQGEWELGATQLDGALFRVALVIRNLGHCGGVSRDQAMLKSFVSVHSILHAGGGEFVSSLDPPAEFKSAVAQCKSVGAWPVLAGDEGQRNLILSSPIILDDYPQIAPEDPAKGEESRAPRILALTAAETVEVGNGGDRALGTLERTEMLPTEQFKKLHGTLRSLRSPSGVNR